MRTKWLAIMGSLLLTVALWGCGSSGGSGGSDVASPETTPALVGSSSCKICHTAILDEGFTGSAHDNDAVAGCEGCHGGGQFHKGTGPIPYPEPGPEQCAECHTLASIGHTDDPATTTVIEGYVVKVEEQDGCQGCHYNNHLPVLTINEEWAESAHAGRIAAATPDTSAVWGRNNWDSSFKADGTDADAYPDKDRVDCQRCHTATGAMNFLNSPALYDPAKNDFSHLAGWSGSISGTISDPSTYAITTASGQNELLYCWGCHSDVATGDLRNPGAITEVYPGSGTAAPAATVNYPDVNASNVCMSCHLGRQIGQNVRDATSDFSNLSFINSHYLAAGGEVFNKSGYEYANTAAPAAGFGAHTLAGPYSNFGYHKNVGVGNLFNTGTAGPCVSCHMSVDSGHTFDFLVKDGDGVIIENNSTMCNNCHLSVEPDALETAKEKMHLAMEELKAALLAKGIEFSSNYPYFYSTVLGGSAAGSSAAMKNWDGVDLNGATPGGTGYGKDVMGAAFNYNLLEHDPGAYAHNNDYALKLLADSIDFLDDGLVDGDANVASDLLAKGMNIGEEPGYATIHNASVVSATASPQTSAATCSDCHVAAPHYGGTYTGTVASSGRGQYVYAGTPAYPVSCAECHAPNVAANADILVQYSESGHGNVIGDGWIHYNWKAGATNNVAYGGSDRQGCARCHTSTGFKAAAANWNSPTPPFGTASAYATDPAEVLSCGACHSDVTSGALRNPGAVQPKSTANPPVALVSKADPDDVATQVGTLPDGGKSNVCFYCHAGGGNMFSTWNTSRVASHHAVAAGTLNSDISRLGYEFVTAAVAPATTYLSYAVSPHKAIGGATDGPCVSCHMPGKSHHFESVDNTAHVINAQTLCNGCHAITYASLEVEKEGYAAAGVLLTAYINNTVTNYKNAVVTGSVTLPNDRAAWYNFKVFPAEEQGGFVHNPVYVKQLIFDSIDWLQDGVLNGTINPASIGAYTEALAWLGTTRPIPAP